MTTARRYLQFLAGTLLGLCFAILILLCMAWWTVKPAPGEWSHPLQVGPWQVRVSVPTLLRMATHPLALRWLEGRTLRTRYGAVQWRAGERPDTWRASCAPCTLRLVGWSGEEIRWTRAEWTVLRSNQNDFRGEFTLGDAPRAVHGRWSAQLSTSGVELRVKLPDTPLADAYALFTNAIPELKRAHIEGRMRFDLRLRWPEREVALKPHIEGFEVSGLRTESLLNGVPSCHASDASLQFGLWLPRAVIAAEDQRFYEHAGYDLQEMVAAWSGGTARGASTLSQQLAKLLFAGDERSVQRKLRELLYAVEMDRTLGKARVLNLYLAIAPWGEGQCGAQAAARHYLHKRPEALTPTEAAWLASLLRNPDRELAQLAISGQVNIERVGWVIENLRPLRAAKREALRDALPGWLPP